jgi:hypothetical protein
MQKQVATASPMTCSPNSSTALTAQQLVPVKTGALQGSGTTEPAKIDGEKITKLVGFNTDYAAAVHEKLQAQHAVGEAKFLEHAMSQNAAKFTGFVAGRVKE